MLATGVMLFIYIEKSLLWNFFSASGAYFGIGGQLRAAKRTHLCIFHFVRSEAVLLHNGSP